MVILQSFYSCKSKHDIAGQRSINVELARVHGQLCDVMKIVSECMAMINVYCYEANILAEYQ